jgi:hypothetical protein
MMFLAQDEDTVVLVMDVKEALELERALGPSRSPDPSVYRLYGELQKVRPVSDTVGSEEG